MYAWHKSVAQAVFIFRNTELFILTFNCTYKFTSLHALFTFLILSTVSSLILFYCQKLKKKIQIKLKV